MKTVQFILGTLVAVVFFTACNNAERLIDKALSHTHNHEWVQAAETLNKIDTRDMAEIMIKGDEEVLHNLEMVGTAIMGSGDVEAIKIYAQWFENVGRELGKKVPAQNSAQARIGTYQ